MCLDHAHIHKHIQIRTAHLCAGCACALTMLRMSSGVRSASPFFACFTGGSICRVGQNHINPAVQIANSPHCDSSRCKQPKLQTALVADSPHCKQPSLHTTLVADSSQCKQPSMQTALVANSPHCRQPLLQTALIAKSSSAYSPPCKRPSLQTAPIANSPRCRQP